MFKNIIVNFNFLYFYFDTLEYFSFMFSIFELEIDDWSGALFCIGWSGSRWGFDFLFLRNLYYKYIGIR